MRDIYKLSNENRQRNKEKKKQKDNGSAATPALPFTQDAHSKISTTASASVSPQSSNTFMKDIGWIKDTESNEEHEDTIESPSQPVSMRERANMAKKSGSNDKPFVPYDYSKAHNLSSSAPDQAAGDSDVFNPYADTPSSKPRARVNKPNTKGRNPHKGFTYSNSRGGGRGASRGRGRGGGRGGRR